MPDSTLTGTHHHSHTDDHHHDHGHDHDHDHGVTIGTDDPAHPLWERDQIVLTSVGIDIGSATSQVLFSRLTLRRMGRELSSAFRVVGKEIIHESAVALTPYAEGRRIDEERLTALVDAAFLDAGVRADEVDTGAVILTGEATRRHNARAIADLFAARTGRFICATAGHGMEATLAAHGSGAVARSAPDHSRVLNIDIGGGTTKLSVSESGRVLATGALHLGARLIVVDGAGRIVRLEPAGRRLAGSLGLDWALGDRVWEAELRELAALMADTVLAEVNGGPPPLDGLGWTRLTEPLAERGPYDAVVFSGGVAEYLYGRESREFGDLGPLFGRALAERANRLPGPVQDTGRAIRATVLGASQYTVQVSGNTIHIGDRDLLPLHNLRVVRPDVELPDTVDPQSVATAVGRALADSGTGPGDPLVFAFRWQGLPSFPRLDAFVEGIRRGLSQRIEAGRPLCLLFEGDIARTVGGILYDQGVRVPVISVDGIAVEATDKLGFVDIGAVLPKSGTVPVSLKSMVFSL